MSSFKFDAASTKSFTKHVFSNRKQLIYLVQGKNQGKAAWHYIQVIKNKLPLFQYALDSGQINLTGYGEVLYSGWGETPPQYIEEELEAMFA